MNFTIERTTLDNLHPLWANQQVYKLRNMYTGQYSLGCYTTLEAANWALKRKKSKAYA